MDFLCSVYDINYNRVFSMSDEEIKTLFNIVDKLEKRIFLLEKVLSSHAKCIGQLQEEKKDDA